MAHEVARIVAMFAGLEFKLIVSERPMPSKIKTNSVYGKDLGVSDYPESLRAGPKPGHDFQACGKPEECENAAGCHFQTNEGECLRAEGHPIHHPGWTDAQSVIWPPTSDTMD